MALNIEVEGTGGIQELALIKHRPMCCTVHYRSIRCFSKQKKQMFTMVLCGYPMSLTQSLSDPPV